MICEIVSIRLTLRELIGIESGLNISSRGVDLLRQSGGDDTNTVLIVAKKGDGDRDWSAYSGYPIGHELHTRYLRLAQTDMDKLQGVLSNGDKLNRVLAQKLFPQFTDYIWRS
jgi:hypothetical protein